MKEYLDPRNGYKLIEAPESEALEPHASEWIEVPEGADCYVGYNPCGLKDTYWCNFHFGKINSDGFVNEIHEDYETEHYNLIDKLIERGQLLWKRHNQPEELPFIDDEPDIETAAGYQLDIVGSSTYGGRSRIKGETDASYREYLRSFGETQSLNDQYAEIEKVRRTTTETNYLMQGKSGEKLMESLARFNNIDRGVEFDSFELLPRTATEIADAALAHIRERASTYDQPEGERSASKTARAFNAITGHNINESEVWLMLQILKDVRQWSRENYHQDSAEDCIAYSALKAESLERNR